jgi:hypothetical protein
MTYKTPKEAFIDIIKRLEDGCLKTAEGIQNGTIDPGQYWTIVEAKPCCAMGWVAFNAFGKWTEGCDLRDEGIVLEMYIQRYLSTNDTRWGSVLLMLIQQAGMRQVVRANDSASLLPRSDWQAEKLIDALNQLAKNLKQTKKVANAIIKEYGLTL